MEKIHREKNHKYLAGITKKNKYTVAKQQKKKKKIYQRQQIHPMEIYEEYFSH